MSTRKSKSEIVAIDVILSRAILAAEGVKAELLAKRNQARSESLKMHLDDKAQGAADVIKTLRAFHEYQVGQRKPEVE